MMAKHLDKLLYHETRNASGTLARVEELIVAGANANWKKGGNTLLWLAVHNGRLDVTAALLQAGANPNNGGDNAVSPLHLAALLGHESIVELLLNHRANPNTITEHGSSPLSSAIYHGHAGIVAQLIAGGASTDHREFGYSMSEYADWCGHTEVATFLRRKRWRRLTVA